MKNGFHESFNLSGWKCPPAKRQGERTELLLAKEAESLQRHLKPAEHLVILDVAGQVIQHRADGSYLC